MNMSESKLSHQDVQEILKLVESAEHVVEFSIKYGDVEVRLSRLDGPTAAAGATAPAVAHAGPALPAGVAPPGPAGPSAKAVAAVPAGMATVKSPMVGTFYSAPAPGAAPFVEIGQKVVPDTVVCIIEVMKLMSSISAGVSGTVREIRVADSQPVEFGQVLIVIEPDR